jgi:hypothetical protein
MEWHALARWPVGFSARTKGAVAAALLALSLFSFDRFDPTASSLVSPGGGIRNALGLPGALIGGTLVEWFGLTSLLIPALIVNWTWNRQGRPRLATYGWHGAVLISVTAPLLGLCVSDLSLGWTSPGLFGWAGAQWVRASTGAGLGAALLLAMSVVASTRLVYVVDWKRRLTEGFAFARFGWGRLAARLESAAIGIVSGFFRFSRGLEGGLSDLAAGGVQSLRNTGRGIGRALAFPVRIRLPAGRAVKFSPARTERQSVQTVFDPRAASNGPDPFDSWFQDAGPGEPGTQAPAAPFSPPAAPSAQARQPAAPESKPVALEFEKQFRAYSDNLDLDWEDRVLKAHRARQSLFDAEDDAPDRKTESG